MIPTLLGIRSNRIIESGDRVRDNRAAEPG